MKRHGHLWDEMISFPSLLRAAKLAGKGKRLRPAVAEFHFDQERGKDPDVLWLAGLIIDGINPQEHVPDYFPGDTLFTPNERRRGIPIGNQTSQFLANVYLDPLDHFVKDRLEMKGYVRYVDDFLIFSDDKRELGEVREQVRKFLESLRVRLHPKKNVISPVKYGIRFLGYRVFPTHRLLAKENVVRFRRRMRVLQGRYAAGRMAWAEVQRRITSWEGHARQANTWFLRRRLFDKLVFQRAATEQPCVAERLVQQSSVERPLCLSQQQRADEP